MMYSQKTEYSVDGVQHAKKDLRREQQVDGEAKNRPNSPQSISASEWLRQVMGLDAPFGKDGLPTVWG